MSRIQLTFILWTIVSCNGPIDKNASNNGATTTSTSNNVDTNSLRINYRDSKGLKQGRWVSKNAKGEDEIYTYYNDTLNGFYSVGTSIWHYEGSYKNGVLDGIQRTYGGKTVRDIQFIKNGKGMWVVKFDGQSLVAVLGFHIPDDTTLYVEAPFPSGKTWYEGKFISTKNFKSRMFDHFQTFAVGVHKIYFENGNLKGIVDYDKKTIVEFDSLGKQIYNTTLSDVNTHNQLISTIYYK